ncbi:kelch-like protein 10 isoform X2 [Homalodisca vitripennis]|uniref:kelch-like protein 10 isoform X2 n=1 Tax=Homalodisca vitripennis TaxID=197043 RepID=UPI001EEA9C84|nr:kelch-like protein 10 isoform X2 [Homalodisca vitripennis]
MSTASWNDLRINQQVCDGVIKTPDGGSFPIHRVILSAFSPYFRAYFTNSLNNGNPEFTEMVISDVSSEIIGLIIEFAYTQSCPVVMTNVHALMIAADKLSCLPVVNFCSDFISRNISSTNCISTWKFAKSYFCRDLEVKSWQYICDHIETVMLSPEFKTLTADELTKLLSADELNVKQEEVVFEAISRWVLVDPPSRQQHVSQLLHCVRFGLVSLEYYCDVIRSFPFNTEESRELLSTIDVLFDTCEDAYYYRYCYFRPRIPNEVIFTFGGWTEGSPTDVIETYDKRSDCWYLSNIKDLRIRAYHAVIELNNLIYVIGGFDGAEYFSTMHCFDPSNYSWAEKACMHDVRCYVSICSLDGEIYAIGGFNGRARLNSAEKYNPSLNQWTMIASLNKIRSDASAATLNGKIFVAGGFSGHEVMRSVEVYSPVTGHWDFVDSMTTPRSGVSLITHGRYIYALGGFDGVTRLNSCERFNSTYNRWDRIADMISPRSNMASVIVDNSIFVIGGYNGSCTIPYTEFYVEEEKTWYESSRMNINRSALSACVCRGLRNARSYTFLGVAVDPTERYTEGSKIKS